MHYIRKQNRTVIAHDPDPAALLPFVPKKITGPLFGGAENDLRDAAVKALAAAASKRLNRFLRQCGITDPRKVRHSLRHRAEDVLRDVDCPSKIANVLLGHGEGAKGVDDDYGDGFSSAKLKLWIDRIGM